jgi:hypothetical protein
MSTLTPDDHVALELCPDHGGCASCQHRADVVSRMIDEHLTTAYEPVHELMRGWAKTMRMTAWTAQQAASTRALSQVLEELRKVVGHEGEQ